jgi:S1-C subfamily serine protease
MEEAKQRIYTTIAIVAVLTLVFSCVIGALAGGLTGYVMARRQIRLTTEYAGQQQRSIPLPEGGQVPFDGIQGAEVTQVIEGSPAEDAGLAAGDIIFAVDRTQISPQQPLAEVINRYEPGDRITVRFWRDGGEDSVLVRLGAHPNAPGRAYLGVYFEMVSRGFRFDLPQD